MHDDDAQSMAPAALRSYLAGDGFGGLFAWLFSVACGGEGDAGDELPAASNPGSCMSVQLEESTVVAARPPVARVLLIEDDQETAEQITAELADRGFEVEWSADGIAGLDKARSLHPDAMIVDRLLPGMDGLTIIEALRKERVRTPVLVLSALGAVNECVRALRMGGDDYLTKPFATVELVARIEALLRRPAEPRDTVRRVGALELDLIERTARRGERAIDLLPREFRLLEYMMQHCDQLLTRAMLLEEVWNYKFVPTTNLVDVHMGRLRHKVDGPGETPMIHNVRGSGFILRTVP